MCDVLLCCVVVVYVAPPLPPTHRSDLTSCKHKHVNPEAVFTPGSGNDEDDLTIGTCDWDYDVYKCDPAAPPAGADSACTDPIPLANGAIKLGTAWGTCYLDMGAEHCHPFCGKLALSFQGGLYSMVAYASQGYLLRPACNTTTAGQRSRLSSAAEKAFGASLRSKLEALHHAAVARSASAKHRHHAASNTTITWEVGVATMMSGAITLTSLETRLEYSRGFLDYVVDWSKPTPLETGAAPSKTALVVKPFTYDIVLVGDGQAEY